MQILDQDHGRPHPAAGIHEAPHQREQLPLPSLRIHLGRRTLGIRHAEEVEQKRQIFLEGSIELQQTLGDALARAGRLVAIAHA